MMGALRRFSRSRRHDGVGKRKAHQLERAVGFARRAEPAAIGAGIQAHARAVLQRQPARGGILKELVAQPAAEADGDHTATVPARGDGSKPGHRRSLVHAKSRRKKRKRKDSHGCGYAAPQSHRDSESFASPFWI